MEIDSTWRSWFSFPESPYEYERIEIVRDSWPNSITLDPKLNKLAWDATGIGLYWRPLERKDDVEAG